MSLAPQPADFHFDLPAHLIAQSPAAERTASRLLCVPAEQGKDYQELTFGRIGDLLQARRLAGAQ